MLNFNKFIPYTQKRYILNVFGDVIDCDNGVIVSRICDGVKVADIHWFDGFKTYEVGLIVVVASLGMNIPCESWDRITVHYIDGDKSSTMPANIYYTFKSPIEAKGHPGFHYIPMFTRYAISENGDLVNVEKGNIKSWYVVKPTPSKGIRGGYRITQVYTDRNERTNISRHRAIALTYIECDENPHEMIVNHLNGIGGDDWISNLEWTTHRGNIVHAYSTGLYSSRTRAVLVMNSNTEEITRYNSLTECCRIMGLKHATLSNRLRNNPGKFYTDGYAYKEDDDSSWINEVVKERITKEIIFRNVFTDETILVNNQREASNLTGVCTKSIWYHLSKDSEKPINGFLFRYFDHDGNSWPLYTKQDLLEIKQMCENSTTVPSARNS